MVALGRLELLLSAWSTKHHLCIRHFTHFPQCWCPPIPSSLPQKAGPRPFPVNAAPAYWPLLGTEDRAACFRVHNGTLVTAASSLCVRMSPEVTELPAVAPHDEQSRES